MPGSFARTNLCITTEVEEHAMEPTFLHMFAPNPTATRKNHVQLQEIAVNAMENIQVSILNAMGALYYQCMHVAVGRYPSTSLHRNCPPALTWWRCLSMVPGNERCSLWSGEGA